MWIINIQNSCKILSIKIKYILDTSTKTILIFLKIIIFLFFIHTYIHALSAYTYFYAATFCIKILCLMFIHTQLIRFSYKPRRTDLNQCKITEYKFAAHNVIYNKEVSLNRQIHATWKMSIKYSDRLCYILLYIKTLIDCVTNYIKTLLAKYFCYHIFLLSYNEFCEMFYIDLIFRLI